MNPPILGFAPIVCFLFGSIATFRYFKFDKKLENQRIWEIMLLPMALPSVFVAAFGLTSIQYRDHWSDFFLLSSPIAVFWLLFWLAASRKESLVEMSRYIARRNYSNKKSKLANSLPPLLVVVVFLIASTLSFKWGFSHVPDWGPCTRIKCFSGEYFIGSRSTIAAGLFGTSMFLAMLGVIPLQIIFIYFNKSENSKSEQSK